jgi:hypothetical protein
MAQRDNIRKLGLILRLDHWLSANASMAVGSLTGPALDTNAFLPMPNPQQFDQMMPNPTLSSPYPSGTNPNQTWDMGTSMSMGMGMDWSQPTPQPSTQVQGQFSMDGMMVGTPMGMDNGVGQENSDEYWNALIDGKSFKVLVWGMRLTCRYTRDD